MEAGEESGPDCQHLGIELGGSGHGRGPGQQDHPPGRLEGGEVGREGQSEQGQVEQGWFLRPRYDTCLSARSTPIIEADVDLQTTASEQKVNINL